jgi:hypothetical protein
MKRGSSALYGAAAFVSGYWELYLMMRPLVGGLQSWWYPIMFGASILLLVGAIYTFRPQIKKGWLIAMASAIPLLLCGVLGGLPWPCWVFTIAVALCAWATLAFASSFNRTSLATLVPSLVLVAWWIPAFIYTLVHAWTLYLSPKPIKTSPFELVLALLPLILLVASVLVSIATLRPSGGVRT